MEDRFYVLMVTVPDTAEDFDRVYALGYDVDDLSSKVATQEETRELIKAAQDATF